jgi:hypothetical protein
MKKQIFYFLLFTFFLSCKKINNNLGSVFNQVYLNGVSNIKNKQDVGLIVRLPETTQLDLSFELKDEIGLDTYFVCIYRVPPPMVRDHGFEDKIICVYTQDPEIKYKKYYKAHHFFVDLNSVMDHLPTGDYHCVTTALNLLGTQTEYHFPFQVIHN